MCAHSVSDTSPPQTDCLSPPVMGTPLENLFPPSTPLLHTHFVTIPMSLSLHTLQQFFFCIYFVLSAQIFPQIGYISVHFNSPLSLHNF